jgi:TonB family protein
MHPGVSGARGMKNDLRLAGLLGILLMQVALSSCATPAKACKEGQFLEATIRRMAKVQVAPIFPSEAKKANASGVAVLEVHLDPKGKLKSIDVLQAPHESIAEAVTTAVKQWVFELAPNSEDTPVCYNGKLTFYFVLENGNGFVRDPKRFQQIK